MTAIIVDDEPRSHEGLKSLLDTYHPDINVLASAGSVQQGLDMVTEHQPDMIFLDIELPDGLGFDLLRKLEEPDYPVIFITAHQQYAITAIEFGAFGYLMKPFRTNKLQLAIDKVRSSMESKSAKRQIELLFQTLQQEREKKLPTRMSISTLDGVFFFEIKDIIHLEADGNYTEFIIDGHSKAVVSSTGLRDYEKIHLREHREFLKVHRSHIVNLHYVLKFDRAESYLLMKNSDKVPVSRSHREELIERMKEI